MYAAMWDILARLSAETKTTYQPQEYDVTNALWRPSFSTLEVHALSTAMDGRFDESMRSLKALMDLGDFWFNSRTFEASIQGPWAYSRAQCAFFQIYEHRQLPRDFEDVFVARLTEGRN